MKSHTCIMMSSRAFLKPLNWTDEAKKGFVFSMEESLVKYRAYSQT